MNEEAKSSGPVEVWYDDGTLILQAEEKSFRVYGGLLSAASSVFRDMFTLPQGGDQALAYGCPSVVLQDSATDASYFLKALHDVSNFLGSTWFTSFIALSFFLSNTMSNTLEVVVGILRLSTKYDVPSLRRHAITQISSEYPTSLHEWDSIAPERMSMLEHDTKGHVIVINLARDLDIPWVIPTAMYYCASYHLDRFYDAIEGDIHRQGLSKNDKKTCILGAAQLNKIGFVQISDLLNIQSGGCFDKTGCFSSKLSQFNVAEEWYTADPLGSWSLNDLSASYICSHCRNTSYEAYKRSREAIWARIPRIFGCVDWESLINLKRKELLLPKELEG